MTPFGEASVESVGEAPGNTREHVALPRGREYPLGLDVEDVSQGNGRVLTVLTYLRG